MSKEPDDTTAEAPHTIDGSNRVTEFERHRRLLFSIAYRMLGSVADAEDILQDAFIRWQRASKTEVKSPKAFLITVVSRLCISHLQSARARREEYVGEWLPEPLATGVENQPSRIVQVYESDKVANAVVKGLRILLSMKPVQRILQVNGEPGIVSYVKGRPQSVFTLQVNDGRIDAIFIVTNPKKLSHLPPAVS